MGIPGWQLGVRGSWVSDSVIDRKDADELRSRYYARAALNHLSHASARNMMCCAVSGQGAGVAAAISLRRDEAFDQLNIGAVQAELTRQGARFR